MIRNIRGMKEGAAIESTLKTLLLKKKAQTTEEAIDSTKQN
jgi:hypothetical protein